MEFYLHSGLTYYEYVKMEKVAARAKDQLIAMNHPLVLSIAKRWEWSGLPLDELSVAGLEGIVTAINKFEPKYGATFSTYATYWITHRIRKEVNLHRFKTYVPERRILQMGAYERGVAKLQQELQREPTAEELSEVTGLRPDDIQVIQNTKRLKYAMVVSLQQPKDPHGHQSRTWGDVVGHLKALSPEREIVANTMWVRGEVERILQRYLTEQEAEIVRLKYGLYDPPIPKTSKEIGESKGRTKQRIDQIHNVALEKLRECPDILVVADELQIRTSQS